jgi:hypothetical protein
VSQTAKAERPARRKASPGPDIALVATEDAPQAAAAPPPAPKPDGAAPPAITTQDPWRYLHPSRVWPD